MNLPLLRFISLTISVHCVLMSQMISPEAPLIILKLTNTQVTLHCPERILHYFEGSPVGDKEVVCVISFFERFDKGK